MNSGLKFSLKALFETFLLSVFVSLFFEFAIFRTILINSKIKTFSFSILSVILTTVFLSNIFSKNNIINILFINGCSRKKISNIKILSMLIYNLIFFLIYLIFKIITTNKISKIYDFEEIIQLTIVFLTINLISEISLYITLIYRKLSIKKGKGVVKTFYRYIYSIIFFIIIYSVRIFNKHFFEFGKYIIISVLLLLILFIIEMIFLYINRRYILNIEIRV